MALMLGLLVVPAGAQRVDEATAWLPPGKPADAVTQEISRILRLINQGSGSDRARFRQELMRIGADAVPRLVEWLEKGSHLHSWTAALILGEVRDPRGLDPLARVATEQSRGDSLAAALALGRFDDPAAVAPLVVQLLSGKSRDARRGAAFALGRMQSAEGTARIREVAREAKQQVDLVAFVVALGMSGDSGVRGDLIAALKSTDDRLRRGAMVALALLPASDEGEHVALARAGDEDDVVRLAALALLARCASADAAKALAANESLAGNPDDRIRAAVALVAAARGDGDLEPFLQKRLTDPSARVRAASIGGLAAAVKPWGRQLAVQGLADSEHATVRLASVVVIAVMAGKLGERADLSLLLDDRDAAVRDAAMVAMAWLQGPAARPALERIVGAKREDRMVRRARELLLVLEAAPELRSRLLRAELQMVLDEAGAAPSWNVHRLANEQILFALGLENALPELGGGGGSEERSKAAAARRVPPKLEDVRRHLDTFPYSDVRAALEVPVLRHATDR